MTDKEIRANFGKAFKTVKNGWELSHLLGYGFSKTDLVNLMALHESNQCRKKIEELLEDCNFHHESGLLHRGAYAQLRMELSRR